MGAQPWAALRERLGAEPWAATALALVDAEDPAIEPVADDLPRSLEQLRAASERQRRHACSRQDLNVAARPSRYNRRLFAIAAT